MEFHPSGIVFLTMVNFVTYFVDYLSDTGRKLLKEDSSDKSTIHGPNSYPRQEEHDSTTPSTPKEVGVAAAGAILSCCVFICPCFFRKRKETAHSVLDRDPNSSEFNLIIFYPGHL